VMVTSPSPDAAVAALRTAAAAEDRLPIEFGPPAIDKPSYELLGETLLTSGQPAEAAAAFEAALARAPERTASLRGLMLAADRSGNAGKAAEVRARLRAVWQAADEVPADVALRK